MAIEVGTESTAHRRSHLRKRSIASRTSFFFNGLSSGVESNALSSGGIMTSNSVRCESTAALINESTVKSFFFDRTSIACGPRGFSPLRSMYFGNASRFGLSGPDAVQGQLFVLYVQPTLGLTTFGDSLNDSRPFHSVAGVLPSTGLPQSYFSSRFGMKFA